MYSTKLISLLASLNEQEGKTFAEMLRSQHPTTNSRAYHLLVVLWKAFPDFKPDRLEKHQVFAAAFPDKRFDANFLRKQASLLFSLLKDFLIEKELQMATFTRELAFLKQLQRRKLGHQFDLVTTKMKMGLEERDVSCCYI